MRTQPTKLTPDPNRSSRKTTNQRHASSWNPANHRVFTVEVRIRGELHLAYRTTCAGLAGALRLGEAEFPAFAERNPWIGQNSQKRRIWILLDPKTESTR